MFDGTPLGYFKGNYFSVNHDQALIEAANTGERVDIGGVLSKDNKILNPEIFFGDYVLNIETRDFSKSGKRIYLTEKELNLLILLAESPGQPLSREDLAGLDEPGRAVDVGINRLRKKIEDDPTMPVWLQTVRGKGYILRPN